MVCTQRSDLVVLFAIADLKSGRKTYSPLCFLMNYILDLHALFVREKLL